jgi:hypothetical protein
LPGRGCL